MLVIRTRGKTLEEALNNAVNAISTYETRVIAISQVYQREYEGGEKGIVYYIVYTTVVFALHVKTSVKGT